MAWGKSLRGVVGVMLLAGALMAQSSVSTAQDSGSPLVEEVLPHEVGENAQIRLGSVADFSPHGGEGVFEPGTPNEEAFSYDHIDSETKRLIGLDRPAPGTHDAGTFVAPTASATSSPSPAQSPSPGPEPASDPDPTGTPDEASGPSDSSSTEQDSPTTSSTAVDATSSTAVDTTIVDDILDMVVAAIGDPPTIGLCDPERVGQTCEEYLDGLCQTRATLPECARRIVVLTEGAYVGLLEDIYPDTVEMIDAGFCTDPDNCDAVLGAVAEVMYRDIREECEVNDAACLGIYADDLNQSIAAVSLIACSSDGCADYVTTRVQVGLAENTRIARTLVFEILEGLPTDPAQLEITLARDAEIPDPLIEPLVDLLLPGGGSASVDETPGGAGEGNGGEVAGGSVTGGGGKRRCVFKGTSYNKGSMDYEGSTNPDDPATAGSGGFSYTDDDLGAHSSNEAYVRSPFSTGQTEHHKDAQMTGVKFKYVKGKYGGDWVTAELHYPWHVEGELNVNTTWTDIPIGGIFSADGIADYSVWVGYVDLTDKGSWNFLRVSEDRLEVDDHRYISEDPVAPPSMTIQLKPGHTYAAWIEIFTSATAHAMFSTRSEVKSYFATHFPTGHPPNNERHDRSWLDRVVLETERRVRCGAGSA